MIRINETAVDPEGLKKTAERLKKATQSSSMERIYAKLLLARVESLRESGRLFVYETIS